MDAQPFPPGKHAPRSSADSSCTFMGALKHTYYTQTNDKTKHFMVMCQDLMGFNSEQGYTLCMIIIQQFAMEDDRWVDDSMLFYTYIMRRYCASFALSCYATVRSFAL